ncbi:MAG: phospholipase D family protein [Desulfobaccales bacterium]
MKLSKINRALGLALALWGCLAVPALAAPAVEAATPPRWAVYFSPQGGCTKAVVAAVDQARSSLHIEAYLFTSQPILKAVIAAQNRGVKVEVILDAGEARDQYSVLRNLLAARVPTWLDAAYQIAHNKIIIIDGETVITGSFNFTRSAEEYNAENLLVIRDPFLAARYEANFQEQLRRSQPWSPGR